MLKPIKLKITYNDGTPVKTIDSSDSGEYVEQYLYIGEYEGPDGATWPHVTPSIDDYLSNGKTPGEVEVTVKYQGVTISYPITIRENPYNGISVSAGKKIYYANSGYTENGQNFKGESISLSDVGSIVLSRKDGTVDDTYRSLTAIPGNEYYLHGNYGINYGGKYYKDIDAYIAAGGSYGEVNVTVSYLDYAGEPEAVNAVLRHYTTHIKYLSMYKGYINDDIQDRLKAKLVEAILKFRFDR